MRREERLAPARDAERALELRPGGDDRTRRCDRERQCAGHEAARAAHRELGPDDRVLAAAVDRPVVCEEGIGDAGQALACLAVLEGDRLVRAVAARHHERPPAAVEQQVVERRVREHQPEPRRAGSDGGGERRVRASANEHDRPLARAQQFELPLVQVGEWFRVGGHDREGLLLPVLACPEPGHRLLVRRIAGEVVAPEPLDRDHGAVPQQRDRLLERHGELRPAHGAGDRLGVEAAVGGIFVLASAVGAHRKPGHRRVRAVVGRATDDREPRPALRAVDERVAVAPVGRVEELPQAVVAGGDVGGNRSGARGRFARLDPEPALVPGRNRLRRHGVDARERRRFIPQRRGEGVERAGVALGLHDDSLAVVEDEAAEREAAVPRRRRRGGIRRPERLRERGSGGVRGSAPVGCCTTARFRAAFASSDRG